MTLVVSPTVKKRVAKTYRVNFTFHPDALPMGDLNLFGSWNDHGDFSPEWHGSGTPMKRAAEGTFQATLDLIAEPGQTFFWGVKDLHGEWMLFENEAASFIPSLDQSPHFRVGHRTWLGLHRQGQNGLRTAVWAPNAEEVSLEILSPQALRIPLTRRGQFWQGESSKGWDESLGHPYRFRIITSDGQEIFRADPYARVRQGPQRGVSDLFLSPQGDYRHRYSVEKTGQHHLRFEAVPPREEKLKAPPTLRLFRGESPLSAAQLRERLPREQKLPTGETWWHHNLQDDGSIVLEHNSSANAYSIAIGPEEKLRGLSYRIEDHKGRAYHDRWSNLLDGHHNWARFGVVSEYRRTQLTPVLSPRESLTLYELHLGSLLGQGGNLRTSTFRQVGDILSRIKKLGFNTICLMPTNATEGFRDWGYLGTASMAHQEAFAEPGSDAEKDLIEFIERAHKLGLRVLTDVVYNHVGGFHNDLWEFDGLENAWFERNDAPVILKGSIPARPYGTAEAKPRVKDPSERGTPWGSIPAYNKKAVYQFYIDHAVDQIERLGFDGIRFDFTHLIHAPGSGDREGWKMLQGIHLRLKYFFPEAITFAEEFPPHPIITNPVEIGGAGFHGMWNTEHQHRLIFDHNHPSITQSLVTGGTPDLARFLEHLTFPQGFSSPCHSATVLSNHDEVGNAKRLYNLVCDHSRGLDIARLVSWFSLLCPGYPILFQGTEDLASNFFSWGLPHTWDVQSHLLGNKLPAYRRQHLAGIRDVLSLRNKNHDLWAQQTIAHHYLHQDHGILAIKRGRFWIVGNFGPTTRRLPEEMLENAQLVLNSEKKAYGYQGTTSRGLRIGGYSVKVWKKSI